MSTDFTVICPTRGRPQKAAETHAAFLSTRRMDDTEILFIVDADDPSLPAYGELELPIAINRDEMGTGMAAPVNTAATALAPGRSIVGFIGDDHRFRTDGWDLEIHKAMLLNPGFVYGNDLARTDIPTQVFVAGPIVEALGWLCLPGAHHLYLDDTWAHLGKQAECLTFLKGVVIEHVHPFYGKTAMDEGYARVNTQAMYQHDAAIYERWLASGQAAKDVATVRAAIG